MVRCRRSKDWWFYYFNRHYVSHHRLSLKRGTGNGEWGTRLTIFHKILHSEQFEGAEFIDDNSFLWFLTPVNVGTCHLLGHSFGRRTANASILMKLCILHKLKALNSMVTIVFCSFWRPPVKFYTCQFWHH